MVILEMIETKAEPQEQRDWEKTETDRQNYEPIRNTDTT